MPLEILLLFPSCAKGQGHSSAVVPWNLEAKTQLSGSEVAVVLVPCAVFLSFSRSWPLVFSVVQVAALTEQTALQ